MRVTACATVAASRRRSTVRRAQRGALAAPITRSSPLRISSEPLPVRSPSAPKDPPGAVEPEPPEPLEAPELAPF